MCFTLQMGIHRHSVEIQRIVNMNYFRQNVQFFDNNLYFRIKMAEKLGISFFYVSKSQILHCMNIEQRAAAVIDKYKRSK